MKKLCALFCVAMLGHAAYSQVTVGIYADGLLSFGAVTIKGDPDPTKKIAPGIKGGVIANIPLTKTIAFMPELNVAFRPTKFTITSDQFESTYKDEATISPLFLELPLNIAYRSTHAKGTFFAGGGPVISIGLGGKYTESESYTSGGTEVDNERDLTIKFDGDDAANDDHVHFKKVDIGIDLFAGYQFTSGLFARVLFLQGFSNLNVVEGNTYRSGYAGIGIGYFFGKGK